MPRSKPFSGKQKKQQLQAKKLAGAANSGSEEAWGRPLAAANRPGKASNRKYSGEGHPRPPERSAQVMGTVMTRTQGNLTTVFAREPDYAIQERKKDATRPFERSSLLEEASSLRPRPLPYPLPVEGVDVPVIEIPKRPQWRSAMTPEELDASEASEFEGWLKKIYSSHARAELNFFEHNLEVWRQLWRSVERADVAVFVLDARIPLFHLSLGMLSSVLEQRRAAVLCINKCDLVHPAVAQAWEEYLRARFPSLPVVQFWVPKSGSDRVAQHAVQPLLDAIRTRTVIRRRKTSGGAGAEEEEMVLAARFFDSEEEEGTKEGSGRDVLTVTLVGDPNMGKSSVMNSIFGKKVVSSSSTPGHTKHFQTLFLRPRVCFCDSPGLVCPKLKTPTALQVLFGSYRIAQVREPYSVVRMVGEHAVPPLHQAYGLEAEGGEGWSPWSVCEALARKRGFLTKGARPETHRAANMILRDVLNGRRVVLSFLPPGVSVSEIAVDAPDGEGWKWEPAQEEEESEEEDDEEEEDEYEEDEEDEEQNAGQAFDSDSEEAESVEEEGTEDDAEVSNPFAALADDDD